MFVIFFLKEKRGRSETFLSKTSHSLYRLNRELGLQRIIGINVEAIEQTDEISQVLNMSGEILTAFS